MTAKTSEGLAQRLDDAGLDGLAEMARLDHFHDYLSPYTFPEMELEAALRAACDSCPDGVRRVKIEDIRLDLINGTFDASPEESEAWAESEAGQETMRSVMGVLKK